jgi:hypothetical protein
MVESRGLRVKRQCGRARHKLKLELQPFADGIAAHQLTIPAPVARKAVEKVHGQWAGGGNEEGVAEVDVGGA